MHNKLRLVGLVGLSCLVPLAGVHRASADETPAGNAPAQVHTPNRPSGALFEGVQGLQRTETTYDPRTGMVTMKLLVQDPNGYFIPTLRRDNFAVFENGVRQQNATVDVERAPVTMSVLMEYGGRYRSMNADLGRQVSLVASQFLDEIGRDDRVAFLRYGDRVVALSEFSADHNSVESTLGNQETPPASETNLYDALIETVTRMKSMPGRKAVLLVSSGLDTFSRHSFKEVLETVRSADVAIYVINLGPALRDDLSLSDHSGFHAAFDWKRADTELGQIASASGGRVYSPHSLYGLTGPLDDLMENLRVRYVITYRSGIDAHSTAPRSVRVELVEAKTGKTLKIMDADGHPVRAHVTVDGTYAPAESQASGSDQSVPRKS
jgi:Ca-activated chloride channel homolog